MISRVFVLLLVVVVAASKPFDGFQVVNVPQATPQQLERLETLGLDVWAVFPSPTSRSAVSFDVLVDRNGTNLLNDLGLVHNVKFSDLLARIEEEFAQIRRIGSGASWYDNYHTYAEFTTHLQELAAAHPDLATFVPSLGQSIEGRDIPAIRINSRSASINSHIYLQGGQHAREWVSPATTIFIAEQLLTATDDATKAILNKVTFDIVPIVNPDGYLYTWTTSNNRLWRKNRRPNTGGSFGVDVNRNWDNHWCESGASRTPSSDTYCGTGPFSEPETKAVSGFLLSAGYKFDAAIDYHSYSQLILRPPGYSTTSVPDETLLATVGNGIKDAIYGTHRVNYTNQAIWQLYLASGGSNDWWYSPAGVLYAYAIELRDTGNYGFQLPPAQIIPTGEENWAGVKWLANHIIAGKP